MSEKKQHKHKRAKPQPVLTPEEKAAIAVEAQAKIEAAKLRQKEVENYEANLETMSFRQLRGELRRMKKQPLLVLGIKGVAEAVISSLVFLNTETDRGWLVGLRVAQAKLFENPFGRLHTSPH